MLLQAAYFYPPIPFLFPSPPALSIRLAFEPGLSLQDRQLHGKPWLWGAAFIF